MEDFKKNQERDKDIVFSKSVNAGKVISGDTESPSINFEKHKIFLYQEDFEHFMSGLEEAVNFVRAEQPHVEPRQDYHRTNDENETSPNLDFDLNIEDIKLAEK